MISTKGNDATLSDTEGYKFTIGMLQHMIGSFKAFTKNKSIMVNILEVIDPTEIRQQTDKLTDTLPDKLKPTYQIVGRWGL